MVEMVSTLKKNARQNGCVLDARNGTDQRRAAAGHIRKCKQGVGHQIQGNADQNKPPPRHGQQERGKG